MDISLSIKQKANELGFDFCGIAKAERLDTEAHKLERWLKQGLHGSMAYMENYFDQRINPALLVPNAQSVISLAHNYFTSFTPQQKDIKISKYAYGKDYHLIIRQKLKLLLQHIKTIAGDVNGRGFVDSAPVLERAWAVKSGIGWVGKNGNLIIKQNGSFFFLATLIVDIQLNSDNPFQKDFCGTCNKCIDACPTNAIAPNKEIKANQCISYFTIELKDDNYLSDITKQFNNWIFGCDICQDVCPWNSFATQHKEPNLMPLNNIINLSIDDWLNLDDEKFNTLFKHSPLKRTKLKNIKRNIKWVLNTR